MRKLDRTRPIPTPDEPLRVALIGAGARSRTIYGPLWDTLKPWCRLVAVCDPVEENSRRYAAEQGVAYYRDIRQLVQDRPMEAAIVVTPIPSHHSLSVFLSSHGIHNLTETTWSSMYCQAREMVEVARRQNVIARVAENYYRYPIDRFAGVVRDSGYLGRIGRIVCYGDHTGYHNNSRWIVFAGSHPLSVQCVDHRLEHPPFFSMPQRQFDHETLTTRFISFPQGFLVLDIGIGSMEPNGFKGHLGRHPRNGYSEWQGQRGTLVQRAVQSVGWGEHQVELRRLSDAKQGQPVHDGFADEVTPVMHAVEDGCWTGDYADTPAGRIEYRNPFRTKARVGKRHMNDFYGIPVIEHVVDFVLAVRGLRESEFNDEDALMSEMMEIGARESNLQEGRRIKLPIAGDLEADALTRERERKQFGVDPLDVEAMLAVSFPKP
jgi:hypothetical protein